MKVIPTRTTSYRILITREHERNDLPFTDKNLINNGKYIAPQRRRSIYVYKGRIKRFDI